MNIDRNIPIQVQPPQNNQAEVQSTQSSIQTPRNPIFDDIKGGIKEVPPANTIDIQPLPGGKIGIAKLFNPAEEIIDETTMLAGIKMPGARGEALNSFHMAVAHMTQGELDNMKDTLVDRMTSEKSSQWDRDLLKEMYEITDAVSEHRMPAPVKPSFPGSPPFMPNPTKPPIYDDMMPFDPGKPPVQKDNVPFMPQPSQTLPPDVVPYFENLSQKG